MRQLLVARNAWKRCRPEYVIAINMLAARIQIFSVAFQPHHPQSRLPCNRCLWNVDLNLFGSGSVTNRSCCWVVLLAGVALFFTWEDARLLLTSMGCEHTMQHKKSNARVGMFQNNGP